MRHQTIQKKLLRYLDGDLPQDQYQTIRDHLASCERCQHHVQRLKAVWKTDQSIPRVAPPPFLWTRLSARLKDKKQTPPVKRIANTLLPYIGTAVTVASIIITVFIGIQIGEELFQPPKPGTLSATQTTTIEQEFGMDYFSVIPPGSMGASVVGLTEAEQEGAR